MGALHPPARPKQDHLAWRPLPGWLQGRPSQAKHIELLQAEVAHCPGAPAVALRREAAARRTGQHHARVQFRGVGGQGDDRRFDAVHPGSLPTAVGECVGDAVTRAADEQPAAHGGAAGGLSIGLGFRLEFALLVAKRPSGPMAQTVSWVGVKEKITGMVRMAPIQMRHRRRPEKKIISKTRS